MNTSFSHEVRSVFNVETFKSVIEIIFGCKFHADIFNSARFLVKRNNLLTRIFKNKNAIHLIKGEEPIALQ